MKKETKEGWKLGIAKKSIIKNGWRNGIVKRYGLVDDEEAEEGNGDEDTAD